MRRRKARKKKVPKRKELGGFAPETPFHCTDLFCSISKAGFVYRRECGQRKLFAEGQENARERGAEPFYCTNLLRPIGKEVFSFGGGAGFICTTWVGQVCADVT